VASKAAIIGSTDPTEPPTASGPEAPGCRDLRNDRIETGRSPPACRSCLEQARLPFRVVVDLHARRIEAKNGHIYSSLIHLLQTGVHVRKAIPQHCIP
jgi:hypothetical protein